MAYSILYLEYRETTDGVDRISEVSSGDKVKVPFHVMRRNAGTQNNALRHPL